MSNADDWLPSHVQPIPDIIYAIYAGLITYYAKTPTPITRRSLRRTPSEFRGCGSKHFRERQCGSDCRSKGLE
jgi:hypothetical protein